MKIETISEARCSNELRGLTPALRTWAEMVNQYSKVIDGDACYWYNERATLSVLAAAAWRVKGWVGLEEYSTRKWRGCDPGDMNVELGKHRSGRCDLFVGSPHGRAEYAIEAKQAWQPIGNPTIKDEMRVVKEKRKAAWADASKLANFEATHRLALTICIPMVAIHQTSTLLDEIEVTARLQAWIKQLRELKNVDGMAYAFPARTRMLTNERQRRVFPGVALLLRKRERSSSRR